MSPQNVALLRSTPPPTAAGSWPRGRTPTPAMSTRRPHRRWSSRSARWRVRARSSMSRWRRRPCSSRCEIRGWSRRSWALAARSASNKLWSWPHVPYRTSCGRGWNLSLPCEHRDAHQDASHRHHGDKWPLFPTPSTTPIARSTRAYRGNAPGDRYGLLFLRAPPGSPLTTSNDGTHLRRGSCCDPLRLSSCSFSPFSAVVTRCTTWGSLSSSRATAHRPNGEKWQERPGASLDMDPELAIPRRQEYASRPGTIL